MSEDIKAKEDISLLKLGEALEYMKKTNFIYADVVRAVLRDNIKMTEELRLIKIALKKQEGE